MSIKEVDNLLLSKEAQIHEANLLVNEAKRTQLSLHEKVIELERQIASGKDGSALASQIDELAVTLEQVT